MIINLSRIDFGGVTGGGNAKPEETFDVQPTTTDQTITPTEGSVFSGGTVRAVTSSIDSNIQPENIKQGVNILGVAGTLSGGSGGSANLVPLTVEASNENRTFNPSSYDADGFNSVNANGYDVDTLYNFINDISNNDTGTNPTVIAEWDAGMANIYTSDYSYTMKPPATTADVKFNQIDWAKNDEVTQITINNVENLTSYSTMFANTPNLQSITADLGHKENIDMSGMFSDSGITNIMNLGLETCKPSNLMFFAQNTKIAQLPMMDTSMCTSFEEMLSESNIETLPAYSYRSITYGEAINWGKTSALTTIEGLVDLGLSFEKPGTVDISTDYYPALVKQSAWNIVNTVYDFVANNGAGNGSTLNFSGFSWVWDEGEQANLTTTANAKGWNITL